MKMTLLAVTAASCLFLGANAQAGPISGQGTWETTLKGRDANGNEVALLDPALKYVFDVPLNLTWLANWNVNGPMSWTAAKSWAESLSYSIGSVVVDDWVLPAALDTGNSGCDFSYAGGTDCGYNVYMDEVQRRGSPLAHMFYDTLGNLAYCPPGDATCAGVPQPGWGLTNTGPFSQMQSDYYWSGAAYAPDPTIRAWYFGTLYGYQAYVDFQGSVLYAVAVRPGDVFAGSVPEPGSLAMLLGGLGALAVARRRRTP